MAERAAGARAVTFAGWEGGEWGTLGPEEAARREAQMFTGVNVVRTRDGLLSPRAGVRFLPLSAVPGGRVWGLGFNGHPGADLWVVIGADVYLADGGAGGPIRHLGVLAATPNRPVQGVETGVGITHITVSGDKCYEINHIEETLTPLDGSPGGDAIELWGERLAVSGRDWARVFFSDPVDLGAWPANNWFDVGARAPVRALFAQRGHLAIGMGDGSWWVRTGTPGSSGELRRVSGGGAHPWHFTAQAAAMLGGDQIAYVPVSADYPALFNGATPREERHLGLIGSVGSGYANGFDDIKVVRGFRGDEWLYVLPAQARMAQFRHGVWTHHLLPEAVASAFVASDAQGRVWFCDGGGPGVAAKVFTYHSNLERPAALDDTFAQPGDDTDTPLFAAFGLPQWWSPDGHEVRVRGVIVDFETYDTGLGTPNTFTVSVAAMRRYTTQGEHQSAGQTWSAPTGRGRHRVHLGFGAQGRGGGFEIRVANIVGVAFRSIVAAVDVWERRL